MGPQNLQEIAKKEEEKTKQQRKTDDQWQIVAFPKKQNLEKRQAPNKQKEDSGISVNLYHAETGKYLDSQTFKYR